VSRRFARSLLNDRGVALTTVIFIGAALTVLSTTAVFVTVQEFRSSTDDRRAVEALAYAEAGIDRMIDHIRSLNFGAYRQAGCNGQPILALPEGQVGNGTFMVNLQVYNPLASDVAQRFPNPPSGGACTTIVDNPRKGQYFLITSTGNLQGSRRVIQQVIKVTERGLPVGLVADRFDGNGTPDLKGISIISNGQIVGRDKLDFTGLDAYYQLGDFWPGHTWSGGLTASSPVPAAAHAVGGLKITPNKNEFPPNPNCTANKTNSNGQSLWDSDGSAGSGTVATSCSGQPPGYAGAFPPHSKFTQTDYDRIAPEELSPEDHDFLKRAAQDKGLYCYKSSTTSYCISQGTQIAYMSTATVAPILASGTNNVIVYYEFAEGSPTSSLNAVKFKEDVWSPGTINGCSDDPALNRSMVLVAKNGSVDLSGNLKMNGAILADGYFDYTGTPTINGAVSASEFRVRGTANFTMDACWVRNIPALYTKIVPTQWSEIDR
jgi:hypothetical protein